MSVFNDFKILWQKVTGQLKAKSLTMMAVISDFEELCKDTDGLIDWVKNSHILDAIPEKYHDEIIVLFNEVQPKLKGATEENVEKIKSELLVEGLHIITGQVHDKETIISDVEKMLNEL